MSPKHRRVDFQPLQFGPLGLWGYPRDVPLTISVIGTGYLGVVHAACMADLGHTVIAIESDAAKVEGHLGVRVSAPIHSRQNLLEFHREDKGHRLRR